MKKGARQFLLRLAWREFSRALPHNDVRGEAFSLTLPWWCGGSVATHPSPPQTRTGEARGLGKGRRRRGCFPPFLVPHCLFALLPRRRPFPSPVRPLLPNLHLGTPGVKNSLPLFHSSRYTTEKSSYDVYCRDVIK